MAYEWYVAKTKPNVERKAKEWLEDQSFACYLPWLLIRKAHYGSMISIREPLFRGYLFVSLDLDEDGWKCVNSTRYVMGLLPRPDFPLAISTSEVEGLRLEEQAGHFRAGDVFPGDRVRVFRGFLADQVLECIASQGDRIKALWACFGAPRVVDVPTADVTVLR
jgi:transcriptional antiterminator RfaH